MYIYIHYVPLTYTDPAGLEVEGTVRQHHLEAAPPHGFITRLDQGGLHGMSCHRRT